MIRSLLGTVGLGAAQSLVRMALGLASVKVTAVYLGPSGMLLVGQIGSFISLWQGVLGNGLNTAVVRLGAGLPPQGRQWQSLHATALRFAVSLGLVIAVPIVVSAGALSEWLLHDRAHRIAVMVAGFAIGALLPAGVLISELNACGRTRQVVTANIVSALLGFCLFVPASIAWGIAGGVLASSLSYAVTLPVALAFWLRHVPPAGRASDPGCTGSPARDSLVRILGFYPMLIVPAVAQPGSQIAIRDAIALLQGIDAAGLLQACWRISDVYLTLVTTGMSLYLMPRLGRLLRTGQAIGATLWQALGFGVGAVTLAAVAIVSFRQAIIGWVFTDAFEPMIPLMPWQQAGDVARIAAWILGFALVALERRAWYMALECLNPLLYWALVVQAGGAGLTAVPIARLAANLVQFVLAVFALRAILFARTQARGR